MQDYKVINIQQRPCVVYAFNVLHLAKVSYPTVRSSNMCGNFVR